MIATINYTINVTVSVVVLNSMFERYLNVIACCFSENVLKYYRSKLDQPPMY